METPRSRAFSLDRVDTKAIGVNTLKLLAAFAAAVIPLLMAGFDAQTAVGGGSVLVLRQVSELAARWAKNNS